MNARIKHQPEASAVLTKAVLNTADQLGLKQAELGAVLGINRSSISRMSKGRLLDPSKTEWQLSLFLVRVFRGLFALTDGDKQWMQHFMNTHNHATGGIPKQQIQTVDGLVEVMNFIDAIRGKV